MRINGILCLLFALLLELLLTTDVLSLETSTDGNGVVDNVIDTLGHSKRALDKKGDKKDDKKSNLKTNPKSEAKAKTSQVTVILVALW